MCLRHIFAVYICTQYILKKIAISGFSDFDILHFCDIVVLLVHESCFAFVTQLHR